MRGMEGRLTPMIGYYAVVQRLAGDV